jgi:uncharacterized membrane protein YkvA (DUF1232 family)
MNFSVQSIYNWYRGLLRNPKYRWWVIIGSVAYIVSPIDISPDVFPIVGWIDDGLVISLLVAEVSQIVKENLEKRSVRSADDREKTNGSTVDVDSVKVD